MYPEVVSWRDRWTAGEYGDRISYHMVVHPDSMLRQDPTARDLMRGYDVRMPDLDVTPWEALLLYEYLVERAAKR